VILYGNVNPLSCSVGSITSKTRCVHWRASIRLSSTATFALTFETKVLVPSYDPAVQEEARCLLPLLLPLLLLPLLLLLLSLKRSFPSASLPFEKDQTNKSHFLHAATLFSSFITLYDLVKLGSCVRRLYKSCACCCLAVTASLLV